MKETTFFKAIKETPFGANVWVSWERPCKLRKTFKNELEEMGVTLTKQSRMLCRIGCDRDKIEEIKNLRADGTLPAENQGLKGYNWVQFPIVLRSIKSGELQLRLQSGTFKVKAERTYFLRSADQDKVVSFEEVKHMMLSSEYPKESKTENLTFNVRVPQLLSVHKVSDKDIEAIEAIAKATETETETN